MPRLSFPLRDNIHVDVAIIGGGIVGIVAARLLKDRGHRVAVIEADRVGHGVTGRSTAKVTAQHALQLQRIAHDAAPNPSGLQDISPQRALAWD